MRDKSLCHRITSAPFCVTNTNTSEIQWPWLSLIVYALFDLLKHLTSFEQNTSHQEMKAEALSSARKTRRYLALLHIYIHQPITALVFGYTVLIQLPVAIKMPAHSFKDPLSISALLLTRVC